MSQERASQSSRLPRTSRLGFLNGDIGYGSALYFSSRCCLMVQCGSAFYFGFYGSALKIPPTSNWRWTINFGCLHLRQIQSQVIPQTHYTQSTLFRRLVATRICKLISDFNISYCKLCHLLIQIISISVLP